MHQAEIQLTSALEQVPARARLATRRVLLVQHCADFSGSTVSGHLLATGLIKAGWSVDVAFGFHGAYIDLYEQARCQVYVVEHRNWLRGQGILRSARRMAAEISAARRFRTLMKTLKPDVVYVNSLVSLAAAIAARRLGIPVVWHIRELFDDIGGEMRIPAFGGRSLVRWVLNRLSDRIIVISDAVKKNIVGGSSQNVFVIPNAVPDECFEPGPSQQEARERLNLPMNCPLVGVPGMLRPVKGHSFFFEAAARVHRDLPECAFAITGHGEAAYRVQLQDYVQQVGLSSCVHFLGTVERMQGFYRACDAICVPSSAESFGRTVIEAFAVGTPVVATAVGGIRETVEHGETGLLVEYGDVKALAAGLKDLLRSPDLRIKLATNARRKAERQYQQKVYHKRVEDVINNLLAARRKSHICPDIYARSGAAGQ